MTDEEMAEEVAYKKLCAVQMCYNHCCFNSSKHHRCGDWHRCYESAKEGAKFGYSRAKEELEAQIKKMSELINRYYMVCTEIPKELRTMTFDSCLEDTRKMVRDREVKE